MLHYLVQTAHRLGQNNHLKENKDNSNSFKSFCFFVFFYQQHSDLLYYVQILIYKLLSSSQLKPLTFKGTVHPKINYVIVKATVHPEMSIFSLSSGYKCLVSFFC